MSDMPSDATDFEVHIRRRIRRLSMPPGYNGILLGGSFDSTPEHREAEWKRYDEKHAGKSEEGV